MTVTPTVQSMQQQKQQQKHHHHHQQQQQHHHLPDVVIAELGELRLVEVDRPRRGVYRLRLGSGPGHLIVCLAVTGGRASGSCAVRRTRERRKKCG